MVKVGDRIYVDTMLFEGYGIVTEIFTDEIRPVQLNLDAGDSDGHKLKRVDYNEILLTKEGD